MKSGHLMNALLGIYIFIFFTYLFGPLLIMSVTAFNSAEFPSITPWECFSWRWFNEGKIAYDGQKLAGLATDWRLHDGFISSLIIGIGVVILSVPIGLAASIVLTQVHSRLRTIFYSISIMPVLFPGVIIGISTVVLWDRIATIGGEGFISDLGRNGIFLTILGQTCFISTYCFLIFVARLQRFDQTQEEAALDLGATQTQVFFKILIPYLAPAIASAAVIAFLASFENYNTSGCYPTSELHREGENTIIGRFGKYVIWNMHPRKQTFAKEKIHITNAGYMFLPDTTVPISNAITFDQFNIQECILPIVSNYVNKKLPPYKRSDKTIILFPGNNSYSNTLSSANIVHYKDSPFEWNQNTELSMGNVFFILIDPNY